MPDLTVPAVERAVATVRLSELATDLGSGRAGIETSVTGSTVRVRVTLGFPAAGLRGPLEEEIAAAIRLATGALDVSVTVGWAIVPHSPQGNLTPLQGVKNDKVGVPVLGVIENMSTFICPKCGHEEALFGEGGGQQLAAECGVPLLGQVPLNAGIRAQTDAGRPPVIAEPDGAVALRYREIARRAAAILSLRPKDQKHKFPKIVVEDRK